MDRKPGRRNRRRHVQHPEEQLAAQTAGRDHADLYRRQGEETRRHADRHAGDRRGLHDLHARPRQDHAQGHDHQGRAEAQPGQPARQGGLHAGLRRRVGRLDREHHARRQSAVVRREGERLGRPAQRVDRLLAAGNGRRAYARGAVRRRTDLRSRLPHADQGRERTGRDQQSRSQLRGHRDQRQGQRQRGDDAQHGTQRHRLHGERQDGLRADARRQLRIPPAIRRGGRQHAETLLAGENFAQRRDPHQGGRSRTLHAQRTDGGQHRQPDARNGQRPHPQGEVDRPAHRRGHLHLRLAPGGGIRPARRQLHQRQRRLFRNGQPHQLRTPNAL